jgi:indole-3-glycerol phosphate synthase
LEYLKKILIGKKEEIKSLHKNLNKEEIFLERKYGNKGRLIKNIFKNKINVIAEIKKASPSLGTINEAMDIEKVALLYTRHKSFIRGISVVTEHAYFNGSPEYIKRVKKVSDLPILRKDFIFNEYQIYESAVLGADCILLISSILGYKKLKKLYNAGKSLGLDVLVEIHSEEELDKAADIGAGFIGINNRDLRSMKVDTSTAMRILGYAHKKGIKDKIIICESGISSAEYVTELFNRGINTFLIGTYFMKSANLDVTLNKLEAELGKEKGVM